MINTFIVTTTSTGEVGVREKNPYTCKVSYIGELSDWEKWEFGHANDPIYPLPNHDLLAGRTELVLGVDFELVWQFKHLDNWVEKKSKFFISYREYRQAAVLKEPQAIPDKPTDVISDGGGELEQAAQESSNALGLLMGGAYHHKQGFKAGASYADAKRLQTVIDVIEGEIADCQFQIECAKTVGMKSTMHNMVAERLERILQKIKP